MKKRRFKTYEGFVAHLYELTRGELDALIESLENQRQQSGGVLTAEYASLTQMLIDAKTRRGDIKCPLLSSVEPMESGQLELKL